MPESVKGRFLTARMWLEPKMASLIVFIATNFYKAVFFFVLRGHQELDEGPRGTFCLHLQTLKALRAVGSERLIIFVVYVPVKED